MNNYNLIKNLQLLKEQSWYWGAMSFEEAEEKLFNMADGSFIVRDSSDQRYILSVTFRSLGKTHHTRIEHSGGLFSFYCQSMLPSNNCQEDPGSCSSVVEFIEEAMKRSRKGESLYYLKTPSSSLSSSSSLPPSSPPSSQTPTPVKLLYPVERKE